MDDTTVIRPYFRGDRFLFSQTVQKLAGIQIFPKGLSGRTEGT